MQGWTKLSTEEQEKIIGRSKTGDIEMPDGIKPEPLVRGLLSLSFIFSLHNFMPYMCCTM